MTDPVFETWAEVDAWATRLREAMTGYRGAIPDRSEARIRRVIAAHSHLREIR